MECNIPVWSCLLNTWQKITVYYRTQTSECGTGKLIEFFPALKYSKSKVLNCGIDKTTHFHIYRPMYIVPKCFHYKWTLLCQKNCVARKRYACSSFQHGYVQMFFTKLCKINLSEITHHGLALKTPLQIKTKGFNDPSIIKNCSTGQWWGWKRHQPAPLKPPDWMWKEAFKLSRGGKNCPRSTATSGALYTRGAELPPRSRSEALSDERPAKRGRGAGADFNWD